MLHIPHSDTALKFWLVPRLGVRLELDTEGQIGRIRRANCDLGQVVETAGAPVNLGTLTDGELLELAVSPETPTQNRRILVIWLYLKESPKIGLEQFDRSLTELAEKELQRRASRG